MGVIIYPKLSFNKISDIFSWLKKRSGIFT